MVASRFCAKPRDGGPNVLVNPFAYLKLKVKVHDTVVVLRTRANVLAWLRYMLLVHMPARCLVIF